ncbi:MAG: hypothetical protein CM15mP120_00480 [Pseudomonadota bacterium]|nr:MAG: hypothetical protein CM15mP120_00480 [Pseudomonadota bacterium]
MPRQVLGHQKRGHTFEHWHFNRATLVLPLLLNHACADRQRQMQAHNFVTGYRADELGAPLASLFNAAKPDRA